VALNAQMVTERCFHLDKVQFLAQKQDFWRSHTLYSTTAKPMSMFTGGWYNVTELNYGWGLGDIDVPFSQHFAGITTVNGWRFGNGLAAGVGVGYYTYNDGYTVPLYLDARYFMGKERVKFFVMGAGGFFFNFENFKDYSRVFVNPGVGLTVPLAKTTHLSFSVGLLTQFDRDIFNNTGAGYRDSYVNMRLGLLFGK
jgi:hypothetical protein